MQRPLNFFVGLWLFCYSALCWANTTFAQDVVAYDWVSLLFALAAGLLGGAGRTVITLVNENTAVGKIRMLLLKDLIVALVGGGAVFLLIEGYNVAAEYLHWLRVDRGLRVLAIVWAGYSRGKWLSLVDNLATDAITRLRNKVSGMPVTTDPVVLPVVTEGGINESVH